MFRTGRFSEVTKNVGMVRINERRRNEEARD